MSETMNDPVTHAKSYPFPVMGKSYVFRDGLPYDMPDAGFDKTGRTPVLAAGSNQSHEQLARKYAGILEHTEIPIQRAMLSDFDSVYAAHLAGYGSVPSTLFPSDGTRVTTYVLWLDDSQLNRMHETERNYTYDHLYDIKVRIEDSDELLGEAYAYSAKVGCIGHCGKPIALREIPALSRKFPSMSQVGILEHVRNRLVPEEPLDVFIGAHIADPELRASRTSGLSEDAIFPDFSRTVIGEF